MPLRARLYRVRRLLRTLNGVLLRRRKHRGTPRHAEKGREWVAGTPQGKAQEQFMSHFRDICALEPHESVLDVGCGLGKLAIPLTQYLDESSRYEGIDIVGERVRKCRKKVSRFYPNFRFQVADIFNTSYNPDGRLKAAEYRFPYADASFDFVFARSVFTHMRPGDVENYIAEIARVLKPKGRCLVTFFLISDGTPRPRVRKFPFDFGTYRTRAEDVPELAVAYRETYVRALLGEHGLRLIEPIRFGKWSGVEGAVGHQDMVIAVKP
jgi:ubiquinone/menaquinone biosynthesis C-methylase UbiE